MDTVGIMIAVVGGTTALIAMLWFLQVAFSEDILWGLACLFIPVTAFVFIVLNWHASWKPAALYLSGVAMLIAGLLLSKSLA